MHPPPVQFVTTEDGVRTAFTVTGSGPPLVVLNEPSASHVEREWTEPTLGPILAHLAERVTLIRLDVRGTGLSDRVTDPGSNAVVGELRAVLGQLRIERYALVGTQSLAPASIIYAAKYPDEVTALVLIDPALRVLDMVASPQLTAVIVSAGADWTIASEVIGRQVFGIGRMEARDFGAHIRACITPEFYAMALRATNILDATKAAIDVRARTMVVRHEDHPYITAELARDVTATIPGASQITVPGLWADDPIGLTDRVIDWLLAE